MNIEELLKLKDELKIIYDEESKELASSDKKNVSLIEDELLDIQREQSKVESLIKIYESDNQDLIVTKLERLYMRIILDISEKEFDALSENKIYDTFSKCFPNEWVFIDDLDKKEQILLDAISNNKILEIPKS